MVWRARRERYAGAWAADKPHGHGEHVWWGVDGGGGGDDDAAARAGDAGGGGLANRAQRQMVNRYRGEWVDGERHGTGTFFYADGATCVGAERLVLLRSLPRLRILRRLITTRLKPGKPGNYVD